MIEIIKPGRIKTTVCKGCGCEFSFEDEDIRKEHWMGRGLDHGFRDTIQCPQCKRKIILEATR